MKTLKHREMQKKKKKKKYISKCFFQVEGGSGVRVRILHQRVKRTLQIPFYFQKLF